jgi:hypothetical protein
MSERAKSPCGRFEMVEHDKYTNCWHVYETGKDVLLGRYSYAEYADPCFLAKLPGAPDGDRGRGFDSARQARAYLLAASAREPRDVAHRSRSRALGRLVRAGHGLVARVRAVFVLHRVEVDALRVVCGRHRAVVGVRAVPRLVEGSVKHRLVWLRRTGVENWAESVPVVALRRILPRTDPAGNVNVGRRKGIQDRDVLDIGRDTECSLTFRQFQRGMR